MRKLFEIGGFVAAAVLMSVQGRNTVRKTPITNVPTPAIPIA